MKDWFQFFLFYATYVTRELPAAESPAACKLQNGGTRSECIIQNCNCILLVHGQVHSHNNLSCMPLRHKSIDAQIHPQTPPHARGCINQQKTTLPPPQASQLRRTQTGQMYKLNRAAKRHICTYILLHEEKRKPPPPQRA